MTDAPKSYESLSVEERFREAEKARRNDRGRRISVLLKRGDARELEWIDDESCHLVVTSPPYWTLKKYNDSASQLGHVEDYEEFLEELDRVWRHSLRILVPGGRLCCVVGDVCLSRRKHGRHLVMPLHADISVRCRRIGFDNLNPIIWHKIANATTEVEGGGRFLGKPYEPNAIIKNDIEFILMQRKPGGYRKPTEEQRRLSMIERERFNLWFQQIWRLGGESTRNHPAPFPLALADRLVRMFSFVGDTVLDPFLGSGTTAVAAMKAGRNAVGVEIDADYFAATIERVRASADLLTNTEISVL
ncbi:MAG: site-specific DNA-methyltransferase [Candidatus Coatesbacteria bacterium]|nr:site-specific DNA-methyltransferase [Candidatus Coatesbacteria bacterium]